jgi:hypothetical protein
VIADDKYAAGEVVGAKRPWISVEPPSSNRAEGSRAGIDWTDTPVRKEVLWGSGSRAPTGYR